MSRIKLHDPDSTADYGIDWSSEDPITASEWLDVDGLSLSAQTFDATSTTVWVSGGVLGEQYALTNRVTTAAGRVLDETLYLRCAQT